MFFLKPWEIYGNKREPTWGHIYEDNGAERIESISTIMFEVLCILSIATKEIKERRMCELINNVLARRHMGELFK